MTISELIAAQLGRPAWPLAAIAGSIWNRRNSALNDCLMDLLELQPDDRVLDIGFGGGYLLDRISAIVSEGSLEGVDVSSAMVRQAEKRYRKKVEAGILRFTCAAVESLPFSEGHFTKVCSVNSIFYWQDVEKGFREIRRVLAGAGRVALCFTCRSSIDSKGFAKHIHLFESNAVVQLLTSNGFKNIQTSVFSDTHRQFVCVLGELNL